MGRCGRDEAMKEEDAESCFALCTENRDCDALDSGKVYRVVPNEGASKEGSLRVVDESGEDHLYPASHLSGCREKERELCPP